MYINVKIMTRSSSNKIGDYFVDSSGIKILRIHITAVPENNKANKAVIKLLARHLKVASSKITIVKGAKDSHKLLHIDSADDVGAPIF